MYSRFITSTYEPLPNYTKFTHMYREVQNSYSYINGESMDQIITAQVVLFS